MPIWDGYKAAGEIIKFEQENSLSHTPIIALTAHDDVDSKLASKEVGIDEFITKPFKWEEVYKVLSKYVKPQQSASLDIDAMLKTINNNKVLLLKLMKYFIENVPREMENLESFSQNGDADSLKKAAHKLKSDVSNFRAGKATGVLREIERLGGAKQLDAVPDLITELKSEINNIIQYFKDYIEKN